MKAAAKKPAAGAGKLAKQRFEAGVSLRKIRPHPRNPRQGDVGAIHSSIVANDFYGAVVVQQSTGYIIAGNHRYLAAKEAGLKTVPAIFVDVDDDRALRIVLVDNRANDLASYNDPELAALLKELAVTESGLEGTLYTGDDLDELLADLDMPPVGATGADEDAIPDPQKALVTKPGDVWVMGAHRLTCGDATVAADVDRLMAGESADLVFTDPPYNVDYEGYTGKRLKIQGDKMTAKQFLAFLAATFASYRRIVKATASLYVLHSSSWQREFQNALEASGFAVRCQIIWAKNTFAWGFGRYKFQHEPIFYGHVAKQKDDWCGDKSQSTLWQEKEPAANESHPTAKPVELAERALLNSSKEGALVVDLFGGSGSTLIGCERRARRAFVMELDPTYCDVIVRRYQEYTSKPATLEDDGRTFDEVAKERAS